MKIVIDVPEKYLNSNNGIIDVTLFTGANNTITDVNVENTYAKFQVLPKGHGDLIDRDFFNDKYASCGNVYCENPDKCNDCDSRIISKFDVDSAPTIIEADEDSLSEDSNRAKIQETCVTCKHFRMIRMLEFNKSAAGVNMCSNNAFDATGHRICKWEPAE